ncbi:MAG TPA: diacylglycerol kinase family protein [Gemmatimonadales bacterium]|nr:diacylglycerol kinase family protein [Gemmatimonadales bacterium]
MGRGVSHLAHLVINPAAGRGAARRLKDRVARAFQGEGWSVEAVETAGSGHGATLAAELSRAGAERVIAVGGDGIVHEVANGLLDAGSGAALGVVPAGSGNDFAKLLGVYRHSPEQAVRRLVTATVRRFDAGRVSGEYFVNTLGFGFGPEVVRIRDGMPGLKGFLSYLVPVLKAFAGFVPPVLEIRAGELIERGPVMMVEVCNGTTAGGSYRFAPDADPADGALDLCVIQRVGLARFLMALPKVMKGTHGKMREVRLTRAREITIRSEQPLVMHLDGELRLPGTRECTITVEPARLSVLVAS